MDPSRELFHQAEMASKINCIIGAIITGTIFILEGIAIWENRKDGYTMHRAQKRWRFNLAAATLLGFTLFMLDGSLTWFDWIGKEKPCADVQIPHVLAYCMGKQFLYLFLYDRAKIVHDSLRLDDRKMFYLQVTRWLLWLTVVIGVPVCFYWIAFIAFSGRVSPEGTCIFYAIYPETIVAFSVSDFILALGMFGIFAFPLWEHVKDMAGTRAVDSRVTKQLNHVIRRNLLFSSLALISTFLCLNTMAVLMWIARSDGTEETDYLREFGLFSISIDNWLGIVLAHMMTSAWLPSFIRKHSRAVESSDGTKLSAKSPIFKNTSTIVKGEKESTYGNTARDKEESSVQQMVVATSDGTDM